MHRSWLVAVCLLGLALSACFQSTHEPDCALDGTCECKTFTDCVAGKTCVDGRCLLLVDAGIGEVGWPCVDDAVCKRGPCLPKGPGNGGVCSIGCNADAGFGCPKGWQCKQSFTTPGFVCAPPFKALCLSCASDRDCNAAGDRCLTLAGGRFCGQDCLLNPCPANYTCRSLAVDAGIARQCVPDAQTCECSAVTAGLQRNCKLTNAVGTCFGFETCQADTTYSGCDARGASKEVCDGIDNDCNGLNDQADPGLDTSAVAGYPDCKKGLACTGKWSCQGLPDGGAAFDCSAPDPTQEKCNGVDDDCNGIVDDGLTDSTGRYTSVRACGSCNTDCFETLRDLARDGGSDAGTVLTGAATCEDRAGVLTCVPKLCAKGYYPSPANAPTVCEKAVTSQCRPCTGTGDCQVPGDECVSVGFDPGSYCAQSCEVSSPYAGCTGVVGEKGCCPTDSTCQQVGAAKRCVPNGNSCLCNAASAGFTRSCFRTAGTATCVGEQKCDGIGNFGACDTSKTTLELCDGKDNDCNGLPDDPFINTRDSGTYDSDTACGSCSTNCKVRWSPTIQHAIGGCDVTVGAPECVIAQCTSEVVASTGACRIDAECAEGVCDPLYHFCSKSCSASAPCGGGRACSSKGVCATTCTTNGDCAAFPSSKCVDKACVRDVAFVNADREETNGCECPITSDGPDVPDTSTGGVYPKAGMPYLDRDCDGIDGTIATSLFVWAQSPKSSGTRAEPFKTIGEAVAAFDASKHTAILVAQGTYVEQVVLRDRVFLYGGYSSSFLSRDVITFPTLIEAPEPDVAAGARRGTVNVEAVSTTLVAGFTIRGYDVISRPAPGQQARSSYAVYVKNATAPRLSDNHIIGGRGGDAVAAFTGAAGANGINGQNGLTSKECASTNCANESQVGGQPGSNNTCPMNTAGNVGAGSTLAKDPQDYPSNFSGNGRGGSNGRYNQSDPSQAAFCKYDCTVPADGLNGGAAQNGSDGFAGLPGGGCFTALGHIVGDDWVTDVGTVGASGTPGRGGGGGGAGGCVQNNNPATCTIGHRVGDLGATGGGGGGAGCGGGLGLGAGGGGASFAIFVVGTNPRIDGNLIDLGFGGVGGKGGEGGYGGLGGQGGRGGEATSVAWCAGPGGAGGRGGNGGAGTGGGGGCGGSVFAIGGVNVGGAGGYAMQNTFGAAPVNAPGAGGVGGASPSGLAGKGGDGATGVVALIQSL